MGDSRFFLGFSSVFAGDASPLRSWLAECVAGWLG
jgi:hypothetical protein